MGSQANPELFFIEKSVDLHADVADDAYGGIWRVESFK